eukprot:evm.model.scf_2414.1 EVM.evm.TU.scf_2414.1   scf_2414:2576-15092(+)
MAASLEAQAARLRAKLIDIMKSGPIAGEGGRQGHGEGSSQPPARRKGAKRRLAHGANEVWGAVGAERPGDDRIGALRRRAEAGGERGRVFDLVYGAKGEASVELQLDRSIRLVDAQNLVLWILGNGMKTPWAFVKNKPLVRKIVLLYVSGIDTQMYNEKREWFSNLKSIFSDALSTLVPNGTTTAVQSLHALLTLPMSKKERHEDFRRGKSLDYCLAKKRKVEQSLPASYYLLTEDVRRQRGYPVASFDEEGVIRIPEGYKATGTSEAAVEDDQLVAVDCEMCETSEGLELTRMSLVGEDGKVLVDELVRPDHPIVDYLTPYSGITEEMLRHVKTSLADAQDLFLRHVSEDTIVVGHSLENDLKAIKILHSKVLDTCHLYPHPRGPPARSSLKVLATKWLKRPIQHGSHDSVVDARAALDLVKLKLKKGPSFGISGEGSPQIKKLTEVLEDGTVRSCLVDRIAVVQRYSSPQCSCIRVQSDQEAAENACKRGKNQSEQFMWVQFQDLARFFSERAKHKDGTLQLEEGRLPDFSDGEMERIARSIDARAGQLFASLLPNTLMMVVSGQGDTSEGRRLQERKIKRMAGLGSQEWSVKDEELYSSYMNRVVQGICLCRVKPR